MSFSIRNNGDELQDVAWKISLAQEIPMEIGTFQLGNPKPFEPVFAGPAAGTLSVAGHSEKGAAVAISNLNPLNLYNAKIELTANGKTLTSERACGGFVGVPKASHGVTFDGQMGDPAWQAAPVQNLDDARQYFMISGKPSKWNGPADLSGKLRFLWDEQYLYLGMQVTDDVFCNPMQDSGIWNGDGLQLLVDPCRESTEKPGKYEYALALGQKGAQAWCNYSSDPSAPLGEARDIRFKATRAGQQGNVVYEIAIPWKRLAPCMPVPGRDLGMCVIINEDDGKGRDSFMAWFGCAHSKQLGMNGDLILLDGK